MCFGLFREPTNFHFRFKYTTGNAAKIGKQTKYEDVDVKSYYRAGGSTIASVA